MKKIVIRSGLLVVSILSSSFLLGFLGRSSFFYPRSISSMTSIIMPNCEAIQDSIRQGYAKSQTYFALGYLRSFNTSALANAVFGSSCLTVSGSRVADRGSCDMLADYFGLPDDFESILSFKPRVKQVVGAFSWYRSLDDHVKNLWIQLSLPIIHTHWEVNMCEEIVQPGGNNYPAGYFSSGLLARSALPESMRQVMVGTVTFGDMHTPIAYGKIGDTQHMTRFADGSIELGYTMLQNDNGHMDVSMSLTIPFGNESTAEYIFEPIAGNCHHVELGFRIRMGYRVWQDDMQEHALYLAGDFYFDHSFKSRQRRSFDIAGAGRGSRYMLLEQIGTPLIQGLEIAGVNAALQYQGQLIPAINYTTRDVRVTVPFEGQAMIRATYETPSWEIQLGYDFWATTKEHLVYREQCPEPTLYALKGDAQLYGYNVNQFIALNATQSKATIHAGQGSGNANLTFTNANADTPGNAAFDGTPLVQTTVAGIQGTGLTVGEIAQVEGSQQPILVGFNDIDISSGLMTRSITNSFFANVTYRWESYRVGIPYLGFGIMVDGAQNVQDSAASALANWSLWLHAGFSY